MRAVCVCSFVFFSACGVSVDAIGPAKLAATDEALLDSARAIVFTFSSTTACSALIDAAPADIDDVLAKEPDPSVQRIPMLRGQIDPDRRDPNFVDGDAAHTFGQVPPNTTVALYAAALDQDPGDEFAFKDLGGSVFAVACRDVTTVAGKREQVPLVLAPAGLR